MPEKPLPIALTPSSPVPVVPVRRLLLRGVTLVAVVSLFLLGGRPAYFHLRAVGLLVRIQNPGKWNALARLGTDSVDETLTEVVTPGGSVRARLYVPRNVANPPGMVVVHGMHHLGIEEPRLVAFARALAAGGVKVLTPELASLADYRIAGGSADVIGEAARSLSASVGRKVGVFGISFAGGLSLLAAADPRYEPSIRFVVSVGAHDDLERVSQFLISNVITRPDGSSLRMQAHGYGPLVMIYSHAEDFFPAADLAAARDTLRLLLWEKVEESKQSAARLSAPSRAKMDLIYGYRVDALANEMQRSVLSHRDEMALASPYGRLGTLRVPVVLLHGAADNVIPPTEMLWLEHDIPSGQVRDALLSPAISHASMEGEPTIMDKSRLLHLMADILEMER